MYHLSPTARENIVPVNPIFLSIFIYIQSVSTYAENYKNVFVNREILPFMKALIHKTISEQNYTINDFLEIGNITYSVFTFLRGLSNR